MVGLDVILDSCLAPVIIDNAWIRCDSKSCLAPVILGNAWLRCDSRSCLAPVNLGCD